MNTNLYLLARIAGGFFFLSLLALIPPATVYLDLMILGQKTDEKSVTEITQAVFLSITVLIFWWAGLRDRKDCGAYVLIAGFFACAFIREMDAVFDYVWKGFWVIPASLTAIGCIAYVIVYQRERTIGKLIEIARLPETSFIVFGLVTLLVFSRTFGSGSLIWNDVLKSDNATLFKSALQEGLELYGYIFILYGSLKLRFLISGGSGSAYDSEAETGLGAMR